MKNKKFVLAISLLLVAATGASVATGVAIHNSSSASDTTPGANEKVTVTWKNCYNGEDVTEEYNSGDIARFKGKYDEELKQWNYKTPTKASEGGKGYFFTGWNPKPGIVNTDSTFTAQFGEYTLKKSVSITGDGFYITEGSGESQIYKKSFNKEYDYGTEGLTYTFILDDSYSRDLPEKVNVLIGGKEGVLDEDYSYTIDPQEDLAKLTFLKKLTDDIVVTASADKSVATFKVTIDNEASTDDRTVAFRTPNSDVTVDWGDGTTPSGSDSSGFCSHTYDEVTETTSYIAKISLNLVTNSNAGASTRDPYTIRFTNDNYPFDLYAGGNKNINNIYFYNYFEAIPDGAFCGLSALSDVQLDRKINSIGNYAFAGTGITSFEFNYSISSFGSHVFLGCENLSSVKLPGNLTTIPNNTFEDCSSLTTINLNEKITTIGENAFNYSGLKSIDLSNVVTIGKQAFYGCSNLESAIFVKDSSGKMTTIGESAFYNCVSLTSIKFPASLGEIGSMAFKGCTYLTSVDCTLLGSNAPTAGADAFKTKDISSNLKIRVNNHDAKVAFEDKWVSGAGVTKYQIICGISVSFEHIGTAKNQYHLDGQVYPDTYDSYSGHLGRESGIPRFPSNDAKGTSIYVKMKDRTGTGYTKLNNDQYNYADGSIEIGEGIIENDIVVCAALDYKVTFDMGDGYKKAGGKLPSDQYVVYGESAVRPDGQFDTTYTDVDTKTKYEFKYFATEDGNEFDFINTKFISLSDSDYSLPLHAVWKALEKTITVSWRNYDGNLIGNYTSTYKYGDSIEYPVGKPAQGGTYTIFPAIDNIKPADTDQYKYTFNGWRGLPEKVDEDTLSSYEVYATFKTETKKYDITFNAGIGKFESGKTEVKVEGLDYGTSAADVLAQLEDSIVTTIEISGVEYTFKGWSPTVVDVTGAATYTAQYEAKTQVKVSWKDDYGLRTFKTEWYKPGDTPVYTGDAPSKSLINIIDSSTTRTHECYWLGWQETIGPVFEDTTYKAKFDSTISISFTGENCSVEGKKSFVDKEACSKDGSKEYTIIPDTGKSFSTSSINVTLEGTQGSGILNTDYTFAVDSDTGIATLTIKHCACNFNVTVSAA